MRPGRIASVAMLAGLSLTACDRGRVAASKPSASGAISAPAPQAQPQSPPQNAGTDTPAPATPQAAPETNAAKPESTANLIASDQEQTFLVAGQSFRLLIHSQTIPATKDRTVEWWELRDAGERVVYRQSYPVAVQNGEFDGTVDITGSALVGKGGSGILIHGWNLPSDPEDGGWIQVFGFTYGPNNQAVFGPFGPPISIEGEFLGVEAHSYGPTPVASNAATQAVTKDILKFRLWTGNFNIVYPVQINWNTGRLQPEWRCPENTSKGSVDRCRYELMMKEQDQTRTGQTFVRLFPEADGGWVPKHVIVQPQSKIEYLEAKATVAWNETADSISFNINEDVWVKVRIDGVEGWIHGEEDFDAVGHPQAG